MVLRVNTIYRNEHMTSMKLSNLKFIQSHFIFRYHNDYLHFFLATEMNLSATSILPNFAPLFYFRTLTLAELSTSICFFFQVKCNVANRIKYPIYFVIVQFDFKLLIQIFKKKLKIYSLKIVAECKSQIRPWLENTFTVGFSKE